MYECWADVFVDVLRSCWRKHPIKTAVVILAVYAVEGLWFYTLIGGA